MGSAHCIHRQGGAFRVCSVLRSRPREPPPPAAPSPGSARTLGPHTVSLRSPGPHGAPPHSAFTFSTVKMSFLRTRKKIKRQHHRAAFAGWGMGEKTEARDLEGRWTEGRERKAR